MNGSRYNFCEIQVLYDFILKHGHMTYETTQRFQPEFVERTHCWRSSGALYQAAYRTERGYYDDLLGAV